MSTRNFGPPHQQPPPQSDHAVLQAQPEPEPAASSALGMPPAFPSLTPTGAATVSPQQPTQTPKKKAPHVQTGDDAEQHPTQTPKVPHVQTGDDAEMGRVATPAELAQLDLWNLANQIAYPDTACLQDLFWATAKKHPEKIALIDGMTEKEWTYAELDAETDRLASLLFCEHGVRPGSVVGILLNRSPEFVIAYVAILKAGGAYMPLELTYPKDLLERAITETEAVSVLTISEHAGRLAPSVNRFLMEDNWLDTLPMDLPEMPEGGFQPKPKIDDLAYVVMSSGTTGKPKGIMCPHRGSVFNYYHRAKTFPLEEDHREGMGIFMTWECFRPFVTGGTAVVIHDKVLFSPDALTGLIDRMKLTRMLFTPSLLQLVLDSLPHEKVAQRMKNIKVLWLCGEVVSVPMAQLFCKICPNCQLLNLYSISECHDANISDLREIDTDRFPEYAPCGISIPNTTCFILNSSTMERVGLGEAGEVYIGGPTLALGYNKMPEKTAERFVPSPFASCPGRLYRTGDLGKLLGPDGSLQIIGRCDFMVKVRGYSVVLGAVEVALMKHPEVSSAIVLAEGDEANSGEKRLIAYVVPKEWGEPPSAASVRAFLKNELPIYAVPSVFLVLNALPVSGAGAGKLNRKALPPSNHPKVQKLPAFDADKDQTEERKAPTDLYEEKTLAIWAELLRTEVEELSCVDSFYDVGGHSLLATRVLNEMEKVFMFANGAIKLEQLLQHPTVVGMASLVQAALESGAGASAAQAMIDLPAEATLDPSIYPATSRKQDHYARFRMGTGRHLHSPDAIFLTGATGYLGAHILSEMLTATDVQVFALVRAADHASGKKRLEQTLESCDLLQPLLEKFKADTYLEDDDEKPWLGDRVIVVLGDLSKPLLGLEQGDWTELALSIDSILHCGADVNLVKPYAALKMPNVLGTQEVLRLAVTQGKFQTKVKPVHYISTNSVFPIGKVMSEAAGGGKVTQDEDAPLEGAEIWCKLTDGYSRSKWVGEQLCHKAAAQRLPLTIMRPGNMAGSARTGAQNNHDFVYLFLKGCLVMGCAPDVDMGEEYYYDLTPVDFAASAAVYISVLNPAQNLGKRFHLQNPAKPLPLKAITGRLRTAGHALESVTRAEFVSKLRVEADKERQNVDGGRAMQELEAGFEAFETYFLSSALCTFGASNLVSALSDSDIACPAIDEDLLAMWVQKIIA